MKSYRNVLYADYSLHFGTGKNFLAEVHYPLYEQAYCSFLPSDFGKKILDVGCGKGGWLLWLKSLGFFDLSGVDLCKEDLENLKNSGIATHFENAIDFLKSTSEKYDVIHAKDFIEHLDKNEAVEFCLEAYRCLNANGQLWLSTFNAQAPLASVIRYGDFTHEIGLTPFSAIQLLSATGFSDVTVKGMHICSSSLKGAIRSFLYGVFNRIAQIILISRHGNPGNELKTCLPDLMIRGFRK